MKVKQLIRELKKMPPNIDVVVSMHDNTEYESAGDVCSVAHFIKESFYDAVAATLDENAQDMFDDMPKECAILRC